MIASLKGLEKTDLVVSNSWIFPNKDTTRKKVNAPAINSYMYS